LLGKDLETNNDYSRCYAIGDKQTDVSEKRLGKHVPAETISDLSVGNRIAKAFSSVGSAPKLYSEDPRDLEDPPVWRRVLIFQP
jgi:hypothetical protein